MANSTETDKASQSARLELVVGVFDTEKKATRIVEKLIDEDFPPDRMSVLSQSGSGTGDDMLGLAYTNTNERVKVWGEQGAAWGALWGLLAGATGLFVLPGIGPLLAAGPIVQALGGAITGATLGGGVLAGAAILGELASALHSIGIPKKDIETIHQAIEHGRFVVILHCDPGKAEPYSIQLGWAGADPVLLLPVAH